MVLVFNLIKSGSVRNILDLHIILIWIEIKGVPIKTDMALDFKTMVRVPLPPVWSAVDCFPRKFHMNGGYI
jgi:hypothetical protein